MNAIIYIRVSSDEQVKGTSLEFQEEMCRKFCEDNGITILDIFREEGESAKDLTLNNRKEFLKALEYCRSRKNQIQAFVVLRVDRFARNRDDHFSVRKLLLGYGTSLKSVTEPIGDGPAEKFIETVLAGASEYENDLRRMRARDGMQKKIEQGIWPFQSGPGWKCQNVSKQGKKKTRPDPPDKHLFPILQKGYKHYAIGSCTQRQLAILLDEWGLAGVRQRKTTNQFVEVMTRPNRVKFAAGILVNPFTGEEHQGLHKPMISDDEMYRILLTRAGRKVPTKKREKYNVAFPLRRLVLCGVCNRPLTGGRSRGNGGVYHYYNCYNRMCSLYGKVIPKRLLEQQFRDCLKTIKPKKGFIDLFTATILDEWKERARHFKLGVRKHEKELAALKTKRKRIFDMREDGSYAKREFRERLEKVELEIAAKKVSCNETHIDQLDIEATLSYATQFMCNLDRQWFDLSPERRLRFEKLVFPKGIPYTRQVGFRTTKLGCIFELNHQWDGSKSHLVRLVRLSSNQIIEDLTVFAKMKDVHRKVTTSV